MTKKPELVFVYNLDSGILAGIQARLGRSDCQLFNLTNSLSGLNKELTYFLGTLPVKNSFLHRDQFRKQVTTLQMAFPTIFLRQQGRLHTLMVAKEITNCKDTQELITRIKQKLPRQNGD